MPNYLTKEEIRQWRSSLEKITLEEFAARLGKEVEESKPTNDVVDIVMSRGTSSNTNTSVNDGFSKIAERAFERERQISHTPFSINRKELLSKSKNQAAPKKSAKEDLIVEKTEPVLKEKSNSVLEKVEEFSAKKDVQITLKRALTDREQLVFDYLLNNVGKTVFAKDLAKLLDLPRDYVYKYIKNLRAKIEGDKLKNVPSGGFVLTE
ncbi:helix-turn-helix domain-containing protein [bacterium]|nr:helix-turn-helix domain-containing protein [bacterium]